MKALYEEDAGRIKGIKDDHANHIRGLYKDVKFYEVITVNGKIYKNRENKLQEFSLFEVY